jgi:hypothetical protein
VLVFLTYFAGKKRKILCFYFLIFAKSEKSRIPEVVDFAIKVPKKPVFSSNFTIFQP